MEQRLTQAQLTQLVAEVERLSQRQQDELTPDQVKQILQELNLPVDLLDEAMIQLQRREALAVQQRHRRWLIGGLLAAVGVAITGTYVFIQSNQQTLSHVAAQASRITIEPGTATQVSVSRQTQPELLYRVTLRDAPVGRRLPLTCDWMAPNGDVVKQNRFATREITTSIWETHCRFKLNNTAPVGTWTVEMALEGRPLSRLSFQVQ